MVLTLLAIVVAALAALSGLATIVSRRFVRAVTLGSAALCGAGALVVAWGLLSPGEWAMLTLPIGPPGAAMRFAFDPLGACFLLLAFVAGAPCAVFAVAQRTPSRRSLVVLPATLAAMVFTMLAADAFALVVGVSCAAAILPAPGADEPVRRRRIALLGVVCLIALFAVAGFSDFAAMRATPPAGWRADFVFVLALVGASTPIAVASYHFWLHRSTSAEPDHMMALTSGPGMATGVYLLIRLAFDLCGPAQPSWWSAPLLLLGAAMAVCGALRSTLEPEPDAVLSAGSLQQAGLAIISLGVLVIARTADLPTLAELALSAAWLQVANLALCRTLLLLCAVAAQTGAGTRQLDRMGGLIHRMPVTAISALAGLFGVVALPTSLGFAGFWLLFQSLLSAARVSGFSMQVLIATITGLIALSMGLAVMAAVRLFGVAFLGRPRTPRTAAAEEVALPCRLSLISLAMLIGLLGLLPGLTLLPMRPALAILANAVPHSNDLLLLTIDSEHPGYAALSTAALLALACIAVLLWLARRGVATHRREPAWSGGFAVPPAWLPFGDPATQFTAASFAEPVHRCLGAGSALRDPAVATLSSVWRRLHREWSRAAEAIVSAGRTSAVFAVLMVLALVLAIWLVAS